MTDEELIARIKAAANRARQAYADDPNVTTVGWGLASRGGNLVDGVSLIFYVKHKLPSTRSIEAVGSMPIPEEFEGFPTDVQSVELKPTQAGSRDENKYDPLRGGPATSNSEHNIVWFNGSGTLGILGRDNETGAAVALSNWHVWGDGGEPGDQIIQPGHPTGGDHVEAVAKIAACGPLLTSLIEWEAPSPLAAGLYAGAAAAAIAAAASDVREPTRRGQDETTPDAGERTLRETVNMSIEYPELPLPGRAFTTEVKWDYLRETDHRILTHEVEEQRVNAQFLLGKLVVTDRATYRPGEMVRLIAAIWDYQKRSCDDYHVVAHIVFPGTPDLVVRRVMHPTACPRRFPTDPPDDVGKELCVAFEDFAVGGYPNSGVFGWLGYTDLGVNETRIVDWLEGDRGILISHSVLQVAHAPASRVTATVTQFTGRPVTVSAIDAAGQVVATGQSRSEQGVVDEIELEGRGIIGASLRGGGGEGVLLKYCITAVREEQLLVSFSERLTHGIRIETGAALDGRQAQANRCCFAGEVRLPPEAGRGRWNVILTVQNVNSVPAGTPPEEAAKLIGGHLLSAHTAPEVLGCTAIMLADHVFDVI